MRDATWWESAGRRLGRAIAETLRPILWGLLAGGPGLALMPEGSTARSVATIVVALVATSRPSGGGRFLDRTDADKFFRLGLVTGLAISAAAAGIQPNAFLVGCVFFVASKTLRARAANVVVVAGCVVALAVGGLLVDPHVLLITGGPWSASGAVRDVLRFVMLALLVVGARSEGERAVAVERAGGDALRDERARIARELHDVVAHHVSVMTIQSEAAGLGLVAETGRTAMTELRRMVGVLRSEEGAGGDAGITGGGLAPQPGLGDLERLVADVRATGTPVELAVDGEPPAVVSEGLGLSVYRIVQESLTNALKHAPGSAVVVRVAYGPSAVRVEIESRGGRTRVIGEPPTGHGIVGMRERARLLDGVLTAGPSPDGGWVVRADLPLDPVTTR
jgi:signal transduction histidine kinase